MADTVGARELPGKLKAARIIMFVQAGLGVLFGLAVMANNAQRVRQAQQAGEEVPRGGGLFGILFVLLAVALAVLVVKVSKLNPSARTWSLVVEGVLAGFAVLGLLGQGRIGSAVSLVLAAVVIWTLLSSEVKAAFAGGGPGGPRFDPRDVPDLETRNEEST